MSEITAISISEIARRRMAAVRSGRLTHGQGKDAILKCMNGRTKDHLIEHFTREYHREMWKPFDSFGFCNIFKIIL